MIKKFNNKWLLAILGLLVLIFILTNYFRKQERASDRLPEDLISIDSASVEKITITTPAPAHEVISFSKTNDHWMVEQNGKAVEPDQEKIGILIQDLMKAQPQRLVSKNKDTWQRYELTDSVCTRLEISEENGKTLSLFIGKFSYRQTRQGGGNQMGIEGTTYVRVNDGAEVYSLDGFLGMRINQGFDAWRNTRFLKTESTAMRSIRFEYPADTGFVVSKSDEAWMIGDQAVEPAQIQQYLNQSANRPQSIFSDFQPSGEPLYRITFEGEQMPTVVLSCYQDENGQYYLHSSLNPTVCFKSDWTEILGQLFVSKHWFFKKG